MKKLLYISMTALAALSLTACGDPLLDDLDTNIEVNEGGGSKAANLEQAQGLFLTAQEKLHDVGKGGGPHEYQVQFNIHIDNYSGYMAGTQNFGGNLPSTYRYFAQYHESPKACFFRVAQAALPVMNSADSLNIKELGAMCNILYCYGALDMVDIYGPMPWTDYKADKQEPPVYYEPVDVVYDSIMVNLKASSLILKEFSSTPQEHQDSINNILAEYDKICGGSVDNWRRFANSLCMRMALRMSNVDPTRARAEAEWAYTEGLLEQSVEYNTMRHKSVSNPLYWISRQWDDTRLNASFENIMKRFDAPFLETLFAKNNLPLTDASGNTVVETGAEVIGVRTGIPLTPRDDSNKYLGFSILHDSYANVSLPLFKAAEVEFLKAEAALRWGICGSAMSNYRSGIKEMLKDYMGNDSGFSSYYSKETPNDIDYVDPTNPNNNAKGLVTIGVKWNSADSDQVKLEKIITQKWLSMFPMGLEAWNDLRRTGYPRIFPVNDIGDGSLSGGELIRRIPWSEIDGAAAQDINTTGIPALGGSNLMRTRLWWDTTDPAGLSNNFPQATVE